jgi:hypothetical protein
MCPRVLVDDKIVVLLKSDRQNSIEHTFCIFGRGRAPHSRLAPAEEPVDGLLQDFAIMSDIPAPFDRVSTRLMPDILDELP